MLALFLRSTGNVFFKEDGGSFPESIGFGFDLQISLARDSEHK
jgi:hypothetical protein